MRRGNILPIAVMAFALVGFLFVLDYSINGNGKWPWSVNSVTANHNSQTTNVTNVVTNSATPVNTSTNEPASNIQLEKPVGPFTVGNRPIVSLAYFETSTGANTLIKMNAETGTVLQQATLNIKSSSVVGGAGIQLEDMASIQFGSDGDSVVFSSNNIEGMGGTLHPYSGIYRTSLSHPDVIQKIVQYDESNQLDGRVAYIESFLYNAESGQIAYITANTSDPDHPVRSIHITDLSGVSKIITEYGDRLSLVGFIDHGQKLNVAVTVIPSGLNNNKGRGAMDTLATANGTLLKTIQVYDDTEGGVTGTIDFSTNALAPNLKNYAFWDDVFGPPQLMFRNLNTKKYLGYSNLDQVNNVSIPWSPDSGKVFLLTKVVSTTPVSGYTKIEMGDGSGRYEKYTGKVFDLAKGVIDTLDGAVYPFIWSPGPDIIYQKIDQSMLSYNPNTKKVLELPITKKHSSNVTGINWVNR